jgi:hypothetical protein
VLPFTVLRRLGGVLEATKPKLVETARSLMHDISEDIVDPFCSHAIATVRRHDRQGA